MLGLNAFLSQQSPSLQTRKALIIIGLQNKFLSPHGRLTICNPECEDNIYNLISAFRPHGTIVWVRTEKPTEREDGASDEDNVVIEGGSIDEEQPQSSTRSTGVPASKRARTSRTSNEGSGHRRRKSKAARPDDELFLAVSSSTEPEAFQAGSSDVQYCARASTTQKPEDVHIVTSKYSAFAATSLLTTLRSKLITEVYLCGCLTNISVYATAMDAARHGLTITIIQDCLGYRHLDRHQLALTRLSNYTDAESMTSSEVTDELKMLSMPTQQSSSPTTSLRSNKHRESSPRSTSDRQIANVLEVDDDDDSTTQNDSDDETWVYPFKQKLQELKLSSSSLRNVASSSSSTNRAPHDAGSNPKESSSRTNDR